jgi:APA family basic amino acid/polyamine antiporter
MCFAMAFPSTTSRRLNGWHLTFLGIDSTIGLGVFLLPGLLAARLGGASVGAFVVIGVLLSLVAVTFAQLAKRSDRNGGVYAYAQATWGKPVAFVIGWTDFLGAALGAGAIAGFLAQIISGAVPGPNAGLVGHAVAAGILMLFAFANYRGVLPGSRVMMAFTTLKLLPLVAIGIGSWFKHPAAAPTGAISLTAKNLSEAALLTLFMCQGFEMVPAIAGEAKLPHRTVPRAILFSLWLSVLFYAGIQMGLVGGPATGSASPLVTQGEFLWGSTGRTWLQVGSVFALLSLLAGRALAVPRLVTPMAEDGLLPGWLAQPTVAIVVTAAISIVTSFAPNLNYFVELSALGIAGQYLLASLCLMKLAYRERPREFWLGTGSAMVSLIFIAQATSIAWRLWGGMLAIGGLIWGASALLRIFGTPLPVYGGGFAPPAPESSPS